MHNIGQELDYDTRASVYGTCGCISIRCALAVLFEGDPLIRLFWIVQRILLIGQRKVRHTRGSNGSRR